MDNKDIEFDIEPSKLRSLGTAYSDKDIVLMFNGNKDGTESEYAVSIPADRLKNVIMALFETGAAYQEQYNRDIGFGGLNDVKE